MSEAPWFSQNCKQLTEKWFFFMSPGARMAWMMLKAHVKQGSLSQKQPNRAYRIEHEIAAHHWNVSVGEIAEMERCAIDAGELAIDGDAWLITDRLAFQSKRTSERYADSAAEAPKDSQTPPKDDSGGVRRQTTTNGASGGKRRNSVHATETETGTKTVTEGEGVPPCPPDISRTVMTCRDAPMPSGIDTPAVRKAIDEFLIYRANRPKKKAPMTARGLELLIGQLEPFEPTEAIKLIENAIVGNYLGVVFNDSQPRGSPNGRPAHKTAEERMKELYPNQEQSP